jgi:hypothetical protein
MALRLVCYKHGVVLIIAKALCCFKLARASVWNILYVQGVSKTQGRRNDVKARGADFRERALLN